MRPAVILAAMIGLILAGCLTPQADPGDLATGGNDPSDPAPGEGPSKAESAFDFSRLSLDDCQGARVVAHVPRAVFPTNPPPGWEATSPTPTSAVAYIGLQCSRMAWGPFERGPVGIQLELHQFYWAPEKCREGEYSADYLIHRWVVTDNELATALHDKLGVSAVAGNLTVAREPLGPITHHRIAWMAESDLHGDLELYAGEPEPSPVARTNRFFIVDSQRVVSIEWERNYHVVDARYEDPLVTGTLGQDTLYAQVYGTQFIGLGDAVHDQTVTATITTYDNLLCEP